jgi:hypothetical protein
MGKKTYDEDDLQRIAKMLAEDMTSQLDILEENLDARIEKKMRKVIKEELVETRQDIKIIKAAVTDTNKDLHYLEKRISRLEAAQ